MQWVNVCVSVCGSGVPHTVARLWFPVRGNGRVVDVFTTILRCSVESPRLRRAG